jgi:uncharacterized cupredoxin-like copper-binding protein
MRKVFGLVAVMAIAIAACGGSTASKTPDKSLAVTPSQAVAPSQAAPAGARTVELLIDAGKITPATVDVKKGETVTFNAKNVSKVVVELIVGTKVDVDADKGDSLKEAEDIAPGTSKPVTYTFDGAGPFAYGDQIEDHYAKGAKGTIVIVP